MEKLREVRLAPYLRGHGPTFHLMTWDTGRRDRRGQPYIGYRFTMREATGLRTLLFTGEDFSGSPLHAIDSDQTVASLLSFLTLRPGDTDADYFEGYTDVQRAYCDAHAETLASEVYSRFGEG